MNEVFENVKRTQEADAAPAHRNPMDLARKATWCTVAALAVIAGLGGIFSRQGRDDNSMSGTGNVAGVLGSGNNITGGVSVYGSPKTPREQEMELAKEFVGDEPSWQSELVKVQSLGQPQAVTEYATPIVEKIDALPKDLLAPSTKQWRAVFCCKIGAALSQRYQAERGVALRAEAEKALGRGVEEAKECGMPFHQALAEIQLADLKRFTDTGDAALHASEAIRLLSSLSPDSLMDEPLANKGTREEFKNFLDSTLARTKIALANIGVSKVDESLPGPERDRQRAKAISFCRDAEASVRALKSGDEKDLFGALRQTEALLYLDAGDLQNASAAAEDAAKYVVGTSPDSAAKPLYSIASAYVGRGRPNEALPVLERALLKYPYNSFGPQQVQIAKEISLALVRSGRSELAAKWDLVGNALLARAKTVPLVGDIRFQASLDEELTKALGARKISDIHEKFSGRDADELLLDLRTRGSIGK